MFTVLSKPRNSSLYLIAALTTAIVALVSFAVVPAISVPRSAAAVSGASDATSDYYQRHPELRIPGASAVDLTGDFYLRHPEWTIAPMIVSAEASDYFQRHPELTLMARPAVDMTDYFTRHPELRTPADSRDLSDYFQRH